MKNIIMNKTHITLHAVIVMKSMLKFIALILTMAFILSSCKKEEEKEPSIPPSPPSPSPTSSIGSFFSNNVTSATQSFTIDASSGGYIQGAEGATVYFFANSFVDQSGAPVTGNVDIEFIEVYDQASMVLLNKTTTAGGQLLVSGGEFKITVTQNSNALELAPGAQYWGRIPTQNPDNQMGIFYADENSDGDLDWVPADSIGLPDSLNIGQDSLQNGYTYDFYGSELGWINCDYFYNDPSPKTTLEVVTASPHDNSNTVVYIHASTFNSVAPLNWESPDGGFKSYANSLPIGLVTTIIVISEIDGQYYSAFIPTTITSNQVENVSLSATTLTDITNEVNAL